MKNRLISTLLVALGSTASVFGYTFTDDFNRSADVSPTTIGSNIGPGWTTRPGNTQQWAIVNTANNGYLTVAGSSIVANSIIWNTKVGIAPTLEGNDPTQISLDVRITGRQRWVGMAFNIIDPDNFYVVRYRTDNSAAQNGQRDAFQVIQYADGKFNDPTTIISTSNFTSGTFVENKWYTINLTVGTDSIYDYRVTLIDTLSGSELLGYNFNTSNHGSYLGGYAGAYYGNNVTMFDFDNFSITSSIPEAGTVSLQIGAVALGAVVVLGLRRRKRAAQVSTVR